MPCDTRLALGGSNSFAAFVGSARTRRTGCLTAPKDPVPFPMVQITYSMRDNRVTWARRTVGGRAPISALSW